MSYISCKMMPAYVEIGVICSRFLMPVLACIVLAACELPENVDQQSNFMLRSKVSHNDQIGRPSKVISREVKISQLTRLKEPQISARIRGYRFYPDPTVQQSYFDFSESFFSDGKWVTHRSERHAITLVGTWQIINNELCVTEALRPTQCRRVWVTRGSDQLAMRAVGTAVSQPVILLGSKLNS